MFWKKKQKQEDSKEIGFEERERKTPVAGYVLLIAMTIISVWLGFTALNDLENVPSKPQPLSYCSVPYISYGWQDVWRSNGQYYEYTTQPVYAPEAAFPYSVTKPAQQPCAFSALEQKYGVAALFQKDQPTRDQITTLQDQLNQKQASLSQLDSQIQNLRQQYGLGLGEKGTQISGSIYNTGDLQSQLQPLEVERETLAADVQSTQDELNGLVEQLKPSDAQLKTLYVSVLSDWRTEWRWYELWVFLLQSLFIFPFFFLVLKLYFRLSAKNSPYTIIATFALITASIFVIKIACVYLWSLALAAILETIWRFAQNFPVVKSLVTYLGMLLSIVLFGGVVYALQKRIFNQERVALRRLRDNRCPTCQFSLELAEDFCPHCGERIFEVCSSCGAKRFTRMSVCPHCGARK